MPFTRIPLLAGKPAPYLEPVAETLDQALAGCFEVPLNDRLEDWSFASGISAEEPVEAEGNR